MFVPLVFVCRELPEMSWTVVQLYYSDGKSQEGIAREMMNAE
jgi:hypothetical protein